MPRRDIEEATDVPFDRSYWVDEEKFLAGCYPGDIDPAVASKKLEYLLRFGVRHIINLMQEGERNREGYGFRPYEESVRKIAGRLECEVAISRRPIADFETPSREEMKAILDEIDLAIKHEKRVFVHCWGGLGRTGTVVGCYLMRHGMASREDVLERIRSLRSKTSNFYVSSPESGEQKNFVREWKLGE